MAQSELNADFSNQTFLSVFVPPEFGVQKVLEKKIHPCCDQEDRDEMTVNDIPCRKMETEFLRLDTTHIFSRIVPPATIVMRNNWLVGVTIPEFRC